MSSAHETTRGQSFAGLRSAALLAIVAGGIGSIGLWRRTPQHPPPLLAVLFVVWISAPFAILGIANLFSPRWPALVRATLYLTTLLIAVASVAIYFDNNLAHRTAHPGTVWVAVPPASVVMSVIVIVIAAMINRKNANIAR